MPGKGPLETRDGITRNKSTFMKITTSGAMLIHTEGVVGRVLPLQKISGFRPIMWSLEDYGPIFFVVVSKFRKDLLTRWTTY